MDLDHMTHGSETRLSSNTGKILHQVGRDALFNTAAIVANRENRGVLMILAPTGGEGVHRLDPMNEPPLRQRRQRPVNRGRREFGIGCPQFAQKTVSGNRPPLATQYREHIRLIRLPFLGQRSISELSASPVRYVITYHKVR